MAIQKAVTMSNGLTLSYHRIAMVKIDLNQQITILVESYPDEACREYEKDYAAGKIEGEPVFPYTKGEYYHLKYEEFPELLSGNVVYMAYQWLKQQPEFLDGKNV